MKCDTATTYASPAIAATAAYAMRSTKAVRTRIAITMIAIVQFHSPVARLETLVTAIMNVRPGLHA